MHLESLGWARFFQDNFQPFAELGLAPARVALEHREVYMILSETGEGRAIVSGRFRHYATCKSEFPTVGDWVAVEPAADDGKPLIQAVLPRRSKFARGFDSKTPTEKERLVAVNIDTLFLVTGLDTNYNLRRIERYVTLAGDSGANPVIVLNKADLCESVAEVVSEVENVAMGASPSTQSVHKPANSRVWSSILVTAQQRPSSGHPESASPRSSIASWVVK